VKCYMPSSISRLFIVVIKKKSRGIFKGVHSSKDGQHSQDVLKTDGRKDDVIPSQYMP
jgi:hypothetical protein